MGDTDYHIVHAVRQKTEKQNIGVQRKGMEYCPILKSWTGKTSSFVFVIYLLGLRSKNINVLLKKDKPTKRPESCVWEKSKPI